MNRTSGQNGGVNRRIVARFRQAIASLVWVSVSAGQGERVGAQDAAPGDAFGFSVAVRDGVLAVGSPTNDAAGNDSGAVYLFQRGAGGWEQRAKLSASEAKPGDWLGHSVAIAEGLVVAGAPLADPAGSESGAAFLFAEAAGEWVQVQRLTASDAAAGARFGFAVGASSGVVVVGAYQADGGRGAAYVFEQIAGVWEQTARLVPPSPSVGSYFAQSLAVGDGVVAVGSMGDDGAGVDAGAVHLYVRDGGGGWEFAETITADDATPGALFGASIGLDGGVMVVGALAGDSGPFTGAAYVFRNAGAAWVQEARLAPPAPAPSLYFGRAVAIHGAMAVVGSYRDDTGATDAGAALVYEENGGAWPHTATLLATDPNQGDWLGYAVAIDTGVIAAGAHGDDDNGPFSGAAWVFERCRADFNCDGEVNTLDVLAFLNAFASGDSKADFNGDGAVNTLDFLAFLNAWTAGCP
ncbi:MAG: hypothetical protein KIS87_01270 [Phycisphaeraceae bacterium]|nr:hypothetical protein [Phycisphaeraceae bacterium]